MKGILVIGATGGVGREVCALGIARGFHVSAIVRAPEKLASLGTKLRVVVGDPLDARTVEQAVGDGDAVVSALGARQTGPTTIHTDGARSLVAALGGDSNRRVVMVSAAMLFEDAGLLAALLRTTVLRHVARDSRLAEDILMRSALDWTIVRPPRLTNGRPTGRWQVAEGHLPPRGKGSISRADVAECLLEEATRAGTSRRLLGVALPGPSHSKVGEMG